jgi:hypothetical protein
MKNPGFPRILVFWFLLSVVLQTNICASWPSELATAEKHKLKESARYLDRYSKAKQGIDEEERRIQVTYILLSLLASSSPTYELIDINTSVISWLEASMAMPWLNFFMQAKLHSEIMREDQRLAGESELLRHHKASKAAVRLPTAVHKIEAEERKKKSETVHDVSSRRAHLARIKKKYAAAHAATNAVDKLKSTTVKSK